MKKLLKLFIISLLLINTKSSLQALDLGFASEDAGQAGAFLDFAASARSLAMGRAFTAVADDAGATYWNPAGLDQLDQKDIVTLYSDLEEDTGFGFVSYAQPTVGYGTFGLGLVTLRSGNFDKRNSNGDQLGSFDQSDSAVLFSHGITIKERFSVGSTLKMVRQQIDAFSGSGFGADVGVLVPFGTKFKAGFTARNLVAPKIKLDKEDDKFPRIATLGIAYKPGQRFLVSVDVSKTEDRNIKVNTGAEFRVAKNLALRAGINESEVSGGIGIQLGDWGVDYAFGYNDAASGVDDLGGSHRFGFNVRFGAKVSEQTASLRWQKEGQVILTELMNMMDVPMNEQDKKEVEALVKDAQQAIRQRSYLDARDLFMTQGYIHHFQGRYERSVLSLTEALTMIDETVDKKRIVVEPISMSTSSVKISTSVVNVHFDTHTLHVDISTNPIVVPEVLTEKKVKIVKAANPFYVRVKVHRNISRSLMTKEKAKELIAAETKKLKMEFDSGNYRKAIVSAKKILSLVPDHIEAATYLDDAQDRLREPIERELKIAEAKLKRKEYLAAIKHLNNVKNLDPDNQKADRLMKRSLDSLQSMAKRQSNEAQVTPQKTYEIKRDSMKSRQLYSQGLLFYSQGNLSAAAKAWKQAMAFDSENTLARNAYNRAQAELKEAK